MKKVKITVVRKACYPDLMEKYENPMEHACDVAEGRFGSPMAGKSQKDCVTAPGKVCPHL